MEVRRRAAVPRDSQLHQPDLEAHPQSDRAVRDSGRRRRILRRFGRNVALTLAFAFPALAYTSRLVDSTGKPVSGAQISVVQQSGSARTDGEGNFTLTPAPQLPATLIVVGSRGEIFPPIYLQTLLSELRIEPAYRETVTVTTGVAPNIEGTPAAAPVIVGSEEIEQRKPAHVAEAIAATPGVSLRGEGPPAVPVVRGLAGGRTLLLIDDARIVSERRAGPSATFIDPLSLGSIEVSRGPGSVAYGSDAIGGVVHMRPRDPVPGSPEVRYDAWAAFGGQSARSAAAEASADLLGGALLASLHARAADDAHDANGDVIINSQYRDRGALLRFVRDAEWGRLRTGFMTSVARDVGAPASTADITTYPDERASLLTLAIDTGTLALRASAGAHSVTTTRTRSTGVESTAVKARDASLRVSHERAGERSRLVTGVDFVSRLNLRASGSIEDADRYDTGAYVSWDGRVANALQLAGGARVDAIATRNRGGYFGDRETDDTALSGYAAATAGPFSGVTATLQVASGYREPVLSDRYFRGVSGRGFVTGNPELEPERSLQFDGGLRWTRGATRAALFAYEYRIRNLVERYREERDFFFRNQGEARIRGIEAEVGARLREHVEVQLGGAIARGETDAGTALDDIAPPTLHASLRWAGPTTSAFVSASAYARDDRPGPVEVERPGYLEIDAGTGWRFSPWLEVRVVVRNLTNVQRFGSTDEEAAFAPGRSVMIGINR
jgi:outer membrane receptor protein involved in Fe transport